MPFGRHKGVPLQEVPASYLEWAARTLKLSSGLRAAVAGELERRGRKVPLPPPGEWDRPPGPCRECGCPDVLYAWAEDRLGRKRIRAECAGCRRSRGTPPSRPPYSTAADAAASQAPVLDALIGLAEAGIEPLSDGRMVDYRPGDYRRVPPAVRAAVRQCGNSLAKLLGDNRVRGVG
jgi:hypothetical protein